MSGKSAIANYIKIFAIIVVVLEILGIMVFANELGNAGVFVFIIGCAIAGLGFCLLYGVGEIIERLVSIDSKLKDQDTDNKSVNSLFQPEDANKVGIHEVVMPNVITDSNTAIKLLAVIAGEKLDDVEQCRQQLIDCCKTKSINIKTETRIHGEIRDRITAMDVEEAYAVIMAKDSEEWEMEAERFYDKITTTVKIMTLRDNCNYVVNNVLEKINEIGQGVE